MSEARALYDRAEAAANAGENGLAQSLLRKLITDHPDSPEARAAQKALTTQPEQSKATAVRVVDVDIKFFTMVGLFVKAAIAVIPAAIILAIIWAVVLGFIGGLGVSLR